MGVSYSQFFEVFDADMNLIAKGGTLEEALKIVSDNGIIVSVERTKVLVSEKMEVVKEIRKLIMG